MADIAEAAENLLALMAGKYDKVPIAPWGMAEYDDYEKRYLLPLTEDERVQVFEQAYYQLNGENLEGEIRSLFRLANSYGVKLSKKYFLILEQEQSEKKKQLFFNKMRYYIEDRWYESDKEKLTDHEKSLLKKYCKQYDLPLPY